MHVCLSLRCLFFFVIVCYAFCSFLCYSIPEKEKQRFSDASTFHIYIYIYTDHSRNRSRFSIYIQGDLFLANLYLGRSIFRMRALSYHWTLTRDLFLGRSIFRASIFRAIYIQGDVRVRELPLRDVLSPGTRRMVPRDNTTRESSSLTGPISPNA